MEVLDVFDRDRQEHIEENILQAEEAKAKAIIHEREASQLLLDKRKEADEIISSAVKVAEIKKETIIKSAKDEIVIMKEKARQEIEQEVEDARTKLHNEIIDIALDASAHLLKREVSSEDKVPAIKLREFLYSPFSLISAKSSSIITASPSTMYVPCLLIVKGTLRNCLICSVISLPI